MKRKLKSRQKGMNLVNWSGEMKQLFEETLSLDYMSSEEEDNTVESREGPRPRVVRRIPWSSETMTKCKADLDHEFRKICRYFPPPQSYYQVCPSFSAKLL